MTVKAIDEDDGENGKVTYHLRNNVGNVQETEEFVIDSDTGELRTRKALDREKTSKYEVAKYDIIESSVFLGIISPNASSTSAVAISCSWSKIIPRFENLPV